MKAKPRERERRAETTARRETLGHGVRETLWVVAGLVIGILWLAQGPAYGATTLASVVPVPDSANLLPLLLVGLLGAMVLNAAFVAAATALELLRSSHTRVLRDAPPHVVARLEAAMAIRPRLIAGCSFGSQACRFVLVVLCFALAPVVLALGRGADSVASYGEIVVAAVILALVVGLLNLIFAEVAPRSFASLHVPRTVAKLYRFARFWSSVFVPAIWIVTAGAGLVTQRFGAKASLVTQQVEDDILDIVETAEQEGHIEEDESELIQSVLEFSNTVAREVMTPRIDLDALPVTSDPGEVVRLIKESGHSRIPLFRVDDDDIVGVIHAKDLLLALLEGQEVHLEALMREPLNIPPTKDIHDLLQEMRQRRSHMAIVKDEFGGTAGIVTLEDILEELVGEIVDEYDNEEREIEPLEEGAFLVMGRTHLDDLNDAMGTEFESDEFDTVGGFVFGHFGRQPDAGEAIDLEGHRFTVEETDGRRIVRLRIEPVQEAADVVAGENVA